MYHPERKYHMLSCIFPRVNFIVFDYCPQTIALIAVQNQIPIQIDLTPF